MSKIKIRTTQNIELEYRTAGIGPRLLAYIIDSIIFIAFFSLIAGLLSQIIGINMGIWIMYTLLGIYVFYDLVCETWLDGQSIGKRILKIKVIRVDGGHPSLGDYIMRWMFRLIDITITAGGLALLLIAFSKKHQRLGDIAAGTTVISLKPPDKLLGSIFTETADEHEVSYPEVMNLSDRDISLIKEIINGAQISENSDIVYKLYAHLENVLGTKAKHPPRQFIRILLADYNHINSQ